MTESEAKSRAERIATLFFQPGTELNTQLTLEIARECWRVANECGWQREEVQRLFKELHMAKTKIALYENRTRADKEA